MTWRNLVFRQSNKSNLKNYKPVWTFISFATTFREKNVGLHVVDLLLHCVPISQLCFLLHLSCVGNALFTLENSSHGGLKILWGFLNHYCCPVHHEIISQSYSYLHKNKPNWIQIKFAFSWRKLLPYNRLWMYSICF